MNKFLILLLVFILCNCKEISNIDNLSFDLGIDSIKINDIINNKTATNIKIIGTYNFDGNPVLSKFIFKEQYYIDLIKIDSISNNFKLETTSNKTVLQPGFYHMVADSDYELLYDSRINEGKKTINRINLISNGRIIKNNYSDSIQDYILESNKFCLKINQDNEKTLCGNKMPSKFNIVFIKKKNLLYIFIIVPFRNEVFDSKIFNKLFM